MADDELKLETKCYDANEYGYLYGLNKKIPDEEFEKVKPYFPSAIDGLRDMYLRETEGAENFRKAAMETDKGSLTDLYHKMAAMSEKRVEKLMELINKALE